MDTVHNLTMKKKNANSKVEEYKLRKKKLEKALLYSQENHITATKIKSATSDVADYLTAAIKIDGSTGCKTVVTSVNNSTEGCPIKTSSQYAPAINGLQTEISRCTQLITNYQNESANYEREIREIGQMGGR